MHASRLGASRETRDEGAHNHHSSIPALRTHHESSFRDKLQMRRSETPRRETRGGKGGGFHSERGSANLFRSQRSSEPFQRRQREGDRTRTAPTPLSLSVLFLLRGVWSRQRGGRGQSSLQSVVRPRENSFSIWRQGGGAVGSSHKEAGPSALVSAKDTRDR